MLPPRLEKIATAKFSPKCAFWAPNTIARMAGYPLRHQIARDSNPTQVLVRYGWGDSAPRAGATHGYLHRLGEMDPAAEARVCAAYRSAPIASTAQPGLSLR